MTDSPSWRTSSFSGAQGGNCVEVGQAAGLIVVRDTRDHGNGPVHRFTAAQWRAFAAAVRDGAAGPGRPCRVP
jgi:hypothetical protein